RGNLRIKGSEDKSLQNVQLGYRNQTPLVHVQFPEVDFLHSRDANQLPLCVVRPAMIAAHEVLGIPLISSTHPVASVPAPVQEGPYPSVRSTTQQDRIFPHVSSDEIIRIGDLGLVTQVEPTARKNSLQLLLVDLLGEKDLTVQEPSLGIHQPLHLTDRGRVHRVPAPNERFVTITAFSTSQSRWGPS